MGVHAADSYVPGPHTLHAAQAPPFRYLFAVQVEHSEALGPVHVPQAALQPPHAVFSFVVVHAVTWYSLALHVLQVTHCPPLTYLPDAQLVQWLAPGPEQVAQLGSHGGGSAAAMVGTSSTRANA